MPDVMAGAVREPDVLSASWSLYFQSQMELILWSARSRAVEPLQGTPY